jgi:hypothetical protein
LIFGEPTYKAMTMEDMLAVGYSNGAGVGDGGETYHALLLIILVSSAFRLIHHQLVIVQGDLLQVAQHDRALDFWEVKVDFFSAQVK